MEDQRRRGAAARVVLVLAALTGVLHAFVPPVAGQRPDGGGTIQLPDSAAFVASSRGRVFYPVRCAAWRDLSSSNLVFFLSAEAARSEGYRPTRNRACLAPASPADLVPLPESRSAPPAPPLPSASDLHGPLAGLCVVERVVDGDTLDCRGGVRIRLLLVDAPEMAQSDFGLRAKLALEELLPPGDSAAVELDVQERDRYGRLLAHLHASDGTWVNRALVRRGWAVVLVVPPNVLHVEALRGAAERARAERRGLWERDAFECAPADFRAGRCGAER